MALRKVAVLPVLVDPLTREPRTDTLYDTFIIRPDMEDCLYFFNTFACATNVGNTSIPMLSCVQEEDQPPLDSMDLGYMHSWRTLIEQLLEMHERCSSGVVTSVDDVDDLKVECMRPLRTSRDRVLVQFGFYIAHRKTEQRKALRLLVTEGLT